MDTRGMDLLGTEHHSRRKTVYALGRGFNSRKFFRMVMLEVFLFLVL
jgi:hypothetical protein